MQTLAEYRHKRDRELVERRMGEERRKRVAECVRELIAQGKMVERRKAERRQEEAARTSAMVADFYTRYHAARAALNA